MGVTQVDLEWHVLFRPTYFSKRWLTSNGFLHGIRSILNFLMFLFLDLESIVICDVGRTWVGRYRSRCTHQRRITTENCHWSEPITPLSNICISTNPDNRDLFLEVQDSHTTGEHCRTIKTYMYSWIRWDNLDEPQKLHKINFCGLVSPPILFRFFI